MAASDLEGLYVHESVENVIPKRAFVEAFSDHSIPAELIGDGRGYGKTNAVVAYFLAWSFSTRAGFTVRVRATTRFGRICQGGGPAD